MITNQEIKERIEAQFTGEKRDKLLFGQRAHELSPKNLRSFISYITRLPRSGGHKKVKAFVNEAMEEFVMFLKGLKESEPS